MTDLISREAAIEAVAPWQFDTEEGKASRRAAQDNLRALPAQAPAVRVKPLVWEKAGADCCRAYYMGIQSEIIYDWPSGSPGGAYLKISDLPASWHADLDAAKAAAQADYESHILAAIEPVTVQSLDKPAQS